MSDDIKSGMLGEGDANVRSADESLENVPATSTGEGDLSGARDLVDPAGASPRPGLDAYIEHVSRTATSPSVETEPEGDPQSLGKA